MEKFLPKLKETIARCLARELCQIMVGPVEQKGEKIPSSHTFFDYIDIPDHIDLVQFFSDHSKVFPTSSRRVVNVGCECLFGLSGYISLPTKTRPEVRKYECLAMLASIVHTVYIDATWVAAEYLRRCKVGTWKEENTFEAVKCWNLGPGEDS